MWPDLLAEIALQLLSAVVALYIFWDINNRSGIDLDGLKTCIRETIIQHDNNYIESSGINMEMGSEYWISLIEELGTTPDDVYFAGTKMSAWLKHAIYREPLREQFRNRLREIARRSSAKPESRHMAYILLVEKEWAENWRDFLQGIIDELADDIDPEEKRADFVNLCWSKLRIGTLKSELVLYSLVLCGTKLNVTPYLSSRLSAESLTIGIKHDTLLRGIYVNDLLDSLQPEVDYLPSPAPSRTSQETRG
jgi:hypothetical protein